MVIGIDGHDLEGKRTGVGWVLMNILKSWERQGVFSQHDIYIFLKDEIPTDLPSGIQAEILPRVLRKSSTALFTHIALPKAAKKHKIDILFCPGYTAPIWLPRLRRSNAKLSTSIAASELPFVLMLHDIIYEARPELFNWQSPADYFLLKWVSRRAAQRASHILVPSIFTAQEVERCYRIPKEDITVTPLAASEAFIPLSNKEPAQKVARRYGVTGPYVFFIGSMFTRRHIPELLTAFRAIAPDFPEHQLLLSGANRTRPFLDIDTQIKRLNGELGRQAIIHTQYIPQEDLPMLYNAASITVWLSDYEGFSLPPLESLACGTPVLTTQDSCMKDTVGECALFIDNPGDALEVASALRKLLSDQALCERLAACGIGQAKNFSWSRCSEQIFTALRVVGEPQKLQNNT